MRSARRRSGSRRLGACIVLALTLLASAAPPDADAAQRPRKSAQDCNDELQDKAAAIAAAGMSASAFFHSCWWNTEPGAPTPIVVDEKAKQPFSAKAGAVEAVMAPHSARRLAGPRPLRSSARPRRRPPLLRDRDEFVVERAPDRIDEAPVTPAAAAAAPPYPAPAGLPRQITVGVPALGQLTLPVLPGLAPAVRAVVDHVGPPGLVSAAP